MLNRILGSDEKYNDDDDYGSQHILALLKSMKGISYQSISILLSLHCTSTYYEGSHLCCC